MGTTSTLPFSECTEPVHEIYWGALNVSKTKKQRKLCLCGSINDRCFSPIDKSSLRTSVDHVLKNTQSYKTERVYVLDDFDNTPSELGYNCYKTSVCDDNKKKFNPGFIFKGDDLQIKMKNENPNVTDKFKCFAILVYTRRFLFTDYPKTEKERIQKKAILV